MAADVACDCDGCAEFRAVHARHCPELPYGTREAKRNADRAAQRRYDDVLAAQAPLMIPRAG
jgi:hypothetical protein